MHYSQNKTIEHAHKKLNFEPLDDTEMSELAVDRVFSYYAIPEIVLF